jgi:5-methyltetrahydrofolate--homocysteine methyltransferase
VHASKILPQTRISPERWEAALDLIYDRGEDGSALERFIGLFAEGETLAPENQVAALPVEERLRRRIINGARAGLEQDLGEALRQYAPFDIINTFLLEGMKTVGELFGSGQMQLPFVLKSAETMKAAVAWLEPHMKKSRSVERGRIVLATVRGDVHDIGKNLVDIIQSNNGYKVFNLGIKQPIASIIDAFRRQRRTSLVSAGCWSSRRS